MRTTTTLLALLVAASAALAADPAITSPPQSRALRIGDHLGFVVGATGSGTLGYQWSFNGFTIPGATSSSLSLTNIQLTNSGTYTVTVTNGVGTNTASAMLTVSAGLLRLYPTNLVLLRAGDGLAPLANSGNTLYLDQVTTNGTYVSSVAVPDSGPSSLIGFNVLVDHYLGQSSNGRAVLFGGCNVTKPYSGTLATTASAVPRGVGSINGLGYYSLAFADTSTFYDGNRFIRGVTSTDGKTEFWVSSAGGVVYTVPAQADVVISTTPAGRSSMNLFNGDLYGALGGTLSHYGGMPTVPTAAMTVFSQANPNDFAISPDTNTIYLNCGSAIATANGGVQRWDFDAPSSTWIRSYIFTSFPAAPSGNNGPDGMVVDFSHFTGGGAVGKGAVLYITTGEATQSSLVRIIDDGPSSDPAAILYTAGVNQVIRGVRFAPVADAPSVTSALTNVSGLPGSTAVFSVGVSGSAPLFFQWKRGETILADGGNISGATTSTLTIANISSADVGSYSVAVTNELGSAGSSASLSLTAADPGIVVPPQNLATNYGTVARFNVTVTGTGTITYKWQKDSTPLNDGVSSTGATISGSSSSNLVISGVSCADSGNYSVTVSNNRGSATSPNAVLSVLDPYVSVQPVSSIVAAGSAASMSVTAIGSAPISYQWQKNGTPLSDGGNVAGALTRTLALTGVTTDDAARYSVIVSGGCGTNAASVNADLTVLTPPQSRIVQVGDRASLVVGATGPATVAYQWSLGGKALPGATSAGLGINNVQLTNTGVYFVQVSNVTAGTTASLSASLTVVNRLRLYHTNLVLLRAGDGLAGLANTGNTLFLDQITVGGEYLGSIMIPDSGPSALIGENGLTDHYMYAATNGKALLIGGFNTTRPYSAALAGSSAMAVPRGIGSVDGFGNYRLAVSDTNAVFNGARILGVASRDGLNEFWTVGGAGVVYVAPTLGPDVVVSVGGGRYSAGIFNNDLFAGLNGGIFQFAGLPSSAATPTVVVQPTLPNDFSISPDGNTMYLTDGGNVQSAFGGVQRWDKAAGAWNLGPTYIFQTPTVSPTGNNGPDGIAVDWSSFTGGGAAGMGAVIYATTGEATGNKVVKIVDQGPGSPVQVVYTAGVNQVARGIRFAPIASTAPQPLVKIQVSGQTVIISWDNAVAGTTYRVQYKSDLSAASWTDLQPDVVASGSSASMTTTLSTGSRFYRVIVP